MIRETIKKAMKARKVKSIDLASYIGVTRSTMSLFLNGKCNLGQEKLQIMLIYLGIELVIKEE
jgi:transcriptional regulator with XRE-family HTH domain